MKFFDLFGRMGDDIRGLAKSWEKAKQKEAAENAQKLDTGDVAMLVNELKLLGNNASNTTDELGKLDDQLTDLYVEPKKNAGEIAILEKKINDLRRTGLEEEQRIQELQKKIIDEEGKIFKDQIKRSTSWKASTNDWSKAEDRIQEQLQKAIKTRMSANGNEQDFLKERNKLLQNAKILANAKAAFAAADDVMGTMADSVASGAGKIFGAVFPEFEALAVIIEEVVGRAIKQITELNNALIGMTRSTGGIVTAAGLGYEATGNMKGGMESLKTAALRANVSVKEYGDALGNLFQGPMGQVVGMKTDLKNAGDELNKYAMTSAKMMKLWGVDISGTVQGLTMNYGMSVRGATDATENFAYAAKRLGLNMATAVKNLQRVTELTNKFYFKSISGMSNMAMLATQLGVSVDGLTGGAVKMNSITDVFSKQQEMSALEMGNYANNLAKIYAARQTGRVDEAARMEMMSLYKDMSQRGMTDKRGQVTQRGITTLDAAGISDEQITALNRMGKVLQDTGLSIEEQMKPLKGLSPEKQATRMKMERENRTMGESANMIGGQLIAAIIDPISAILGPPLKALMGGIESIVSALSAMWKVVNQVWMAFSGLGQIISFLQGFFEGFYDQVTSAFDSLKGAFEDLSAKLKPITDFVVNVFKTLGKWLGNIVGWLIMLPFKVLYYVLLGVIKVVGWVVDGLKLLWNGLKWVGNGLIKVFKPLIDIIKSLWNAISDFIDWIISWIPGMGKPEETADKMKTGITDAVWKDIFGNVKGKAAAGSTGTPGTPTPSVLGTISREDKAAKTMKEMNSKAFDLTKDKNYVKVNVTTNVDPITGENTARKKTMTN